MLYKIELRYYPNKNGINKENSPLLWRVLNFLLITKYFSSSIHICFHFIENNSFFSDLFLLREKITTCNEI